MTGISQVRTLDATKSVHTGWTRYFSTVNCVASLFAEIVKAFPWVAFFAIAGVFFRVANAALGSANIVGGELEEVVARVALLLFAISVLLLTIKIHQLNGMKGLVAVVIVLLFGSSLLKVTDEFAYLNNVPFLGDSSALNNFAEDCFEAVAILVFILVFGGTILRLQIAQRSLAAQVEALKNEATARASLEARLSLFTESVPGVAVQGYDTNGIVVLWNKASADLYGYTADEAIGKSICDLIAPPKLRRDLEKWLVDAKHATQSGALAPAGEILFRDKAGRLVSVYSVHTVVCAPGQENLLMRMDVDLRERKELEKAILFNEERFRAIVQESSDMHSVINKDGVFTYVAPAADRILGCGPQESLLGSRITDRLHPEDIGRLQQTLCELGRGNHMKAAIEIRMRHADGNWRLVEIVASNHIHNPAIRGIVLNSRDITARKQLEEQYRQSQKMEALGVLVGGIAHDFNNLLTAILFRSELASSTMEDDSVLSKSLSEIRDVAERASRLTRQLLLFSRLGARQVQHVSVDAIVSDMNKMLGRIIGEDIHFEIRLASDAACVRADPAWLEQVILNLVVNARDAMPGGGKVLIETAVELIGMTTAAELSLPNPGRFVVCSVRDTGCGMDAHTLEKLFEPFFTTKSNGTGLGLATVYGNVKEMNGGISVQSQLGTGTTFRIYIPVASRSTAKSESHAESSENLPRDKTILVVEDDKIVRQMVIESLKGAGYATLEASSPEQALSIAKEYDGRIDLLLTDVVMPEMPGPRVFEAVRELRPGIPAVYMTGYSGDTLDRCGIAPNSPYLIQKPFSPKALVNAILDALNEPQQCAGTSSD